MQDCHCHSPRVDFFYRKVSFVADWQLGQKGRETALSTEISSPLRVRMVLVSTGPLARLAAGTLAHHLGCATEDALARLGEAPSVLAEAMDAGRARHIAGLLRAFGLKVRIDAPDSDEVRFDLSIQIAVPVRMQRAVRAIAGQTGLPVEQVADRLTLPGGLMLTGLRRVEIDRMHEALCHHSSLVLTVSDPASAVYDVFLTDGLAGDDLSDRLRMMGAQADPITGAVAAGLDRALCDHLRGRFVQPDLLIIDRAFQRYDLYLSRVTGWVSRDLADFLAARTGLPRSGFEVLPERLPLRIESGLSHAASRQFRADYASIGLHVLLVLSGLGQRPDNPNL